jgi:hypothetical protein
MTIKASGRLVLIVATGLFVCFAGPSPVAAATDGNATAGSQSASSESDSAAAEPAARHKYARHDSRHSKKYAHHRSDKVALKSSAGKADATDVAADSDASTAIPPTVANARAQLAAADAPESNGTPAGSARAMSTRANDILQAAPEKPAEAQPAAETQIIPPDQLNEVDRTLPASAASSPAPAMTSTDAPAQATTSADPPAEPVVAAASGDSSSLEDRTSLIGKIFMACGGVLTLASAVRMFMG